MIAIETMKSIGIAGYIWISKSDADCIQYRTMSPEPLAMGKTTNWPPLIKSGSNVNNDLKTISTANAHYSGRGEGDFDRMMKIKAYQLE